MIRPAHLRGRRSARGQAQDFPVQDEPVQDEPVQDEPVQDEPDQREPDHREPDQDEPDQDEPDQREPDQDEPDQDDAHQHDPLHDEPPHVPPLQAVKEALAGAHFLALNGPRMCASPVSSTPSSVMLEHCTCSGPTATFSPSPHDTLAPPTLRAARPSWTPSKDRVVPRISASAPSPDSVTVHELVEHETFSEPKLKLQAVSRASSSPAASSPEAIRTGRRVIEDMDRA